MEISTEMLYNYKLVCNDVHLAPLVEKSTAIQLLDKKSIGLDSNSTSKLEFKIVFTPPKAFRYI